MLLVASGKWLLHVRNLQGAFAIKVRGRAITNALERVDAQISVQFQLLMGLL